MLFGYKLFLDNKPATVVSAAETVEEFETWLQGVATQNPKVNFNSMKLTTFFEMMSRESPFYGYKHSVGVVYHENETQRDAFISEHNISEQQTAYCHDRHREMMYAEKKRLGNDTGLFSTANEGKTIAEIYGLTEEDPNDNRTPEEIERDKKLKEKLDKLEKEGKLSAPSFAPPKTVNNSQPTTTNVGSADTASTAPVTSTAAPVPSVETTPTGALPTVPAKRASILDPFKAIVDGLLSKQPATKASEIFNELKNNHGYAGGLTTVKDYVREMKTRKSEDKTWVGVEDIHVKVNADGSFEVDKVLAHKRGGPVDEAAKAAAIEEYDRKIEEAKGGKRSFSPGDFATVLRGDGRDQNYGIEPTKAEVDDASSGTREITLSPEAEAARKAYREKQETLAGKQEIKREINDRLAENKEKHEAENHIFQGVDLVGDETPIEALPKDVQSEIAKLANSKSTILVKHYPHNATLGGKYLFPFESFDTSYTVPEPVIINLKVIGSVSVVGPVVNVCEKINTTEPAWAIYRYVDDSNEVWVVKIR